MTPENLPCFCCSELTFKQCCQPILSGDRKPANAEALMRSRFSAYATNNFQYILQTYTLAERKALSLSDITDNAKQTQWLSLDVINHQTVGNTAQVEFKALYKIAEHYYVMHELSDFNFEDGNWLYRSGIMQKETGEFKPERNAPCPCQSGKKYE